MKKTNKKQLTASIQENILAIEMFLEQTREPHTFESEKIKKNVTTLAALLPGIKDEITAKLQELEQIKSRGQNLELDCQSLKTEIKTLNKTLREKNKELVKLQDVVKIIDDPLSKDKIKDFKQLKKEVQTLEESNREKNRQMAELQEKIDTLEALKTELQQHIETIADEKGKISQLQKNIQQGETKLEELTTGESQKLQDLYDQEVLSVLRLALKAKHENLEPPHWQKILEILEIEDEKQQ